MRSPVHTLLGPLALTVAFCLLAAEPSRAVLVPPAANYVPQRGGGAVAPCGGDVLCVGPSGTFDTISAAVAAASSGATIQVEAGTYAERVLVRGKSLELRGGFAPGFASRNPAANETLIDAGGGGTVVTLENAKGAIVDGFTITGGRAPLDPVNGARGSGIRVTDSGSVTIVGNLIKDNDDGQDFRSCDCAAVGGGIEVSGPPKASITIQGNIIRGNRSHRGGAMAVFTNALIEGNLIEDNRGGADHGGGLYLSAPNMTIRRNLIRRNTVGDQAGYGWGGGAIFFGSGSGKPHARFEANRWTGNSAPSIGSALFIDDEATARITGDLLYGNACPETGGAALYVDGGGDPPTGSRATLENVTMAGHACGRGKRGSAIYTEGGSSIAVTGSIITGNGGASQIFACVACAKDEPKTPRSTIAYSLVGGLTVNVRRGAGIRRSNPGFVDPGAGDFHLARGSRAINAADPKASVGLEPRPHGRRRNLGAYGGTREAT